LQSSSAKLLDMSYLQFEILGHCKFLLQLKIFLEW